jgi:hypothetical protein
MRMRTVTLVLALTLSCAAAPSFGQARILSAPEPAPAQGPEQAQQLPSQAPAKTETSPQVPAPPSANAQGLPKTQDQLPSEVLNQNRGRPLMPGRYSFTRVEKGLLRLDVQAGGVSFCRPIDAGWVCDAVPEERAALEKEMDELRGELKAAKDEVATAKLEIAALKGEIEGLRAPPPPPVPPQTVPPVPSTPSEHSGLTITLPNEEDIARARGYIADTWRRLVEMIAQWQKDVLPKG